MKTRKVTSPEMDSKRKATNDLNHENWDKSEEPEERGTFQMASEDEIKGRIIKKARRKITSSTGEGSQVKSVFSGFSGFTNTGSVATTVSNAGSPFSFLSKLSSAEAAKADTGTESKDDKEFCFEKSNTYFAKLKGLNQNVSNWIKTHVDKNPLCILTPIFTDYEKYLKEMQENKPEGASTGDTYCKSGNLPNDKGNTANDKATTQSSTNQFLFGTYSFNAAANKESVSDSSSVFGKSTCAQENKESVSDSSSVFGKSTCAQENKGGGGMLFKLPADSSETCSSKNNIFSNASPVISGVKTAEVPGMISTGFSFSNAKPFTFSSEITKPREATTAVKDNGEDEDEPPKVEFNLVVEEDSIYSKKCKVFVKSGSSYAERGVGMLYIKPIKGKDKTQLIVRADTNLGNILLNIILNESIPVQLMGKNNVMMVCIPTPESEPKPTSVLLRVKTADEANELLTTINKYKKSTGD